MESEEWTGHIELTIYSNRNRSGKEITPGRQTDIISDY